VVSSYEISSSVAALYSSTSGNVGSVGSASFMDSLSQTMADWVTSMTDSKITAGEVSAIEQGSYASYDAEADLTETLYDGATMTLFATTKINNASTVISTYFSFLSSLNDLNDKASQILTG